MAFGFTRQLGTSRNYVATGQEAFDHGYTPGQALSRRQYDNYVSRLGRRTSIPGFEQIRETERRLEELARDLERRAALAQSEFEREAIAQARASQQAQREALGKAARRRQRQQAGQRRYNSFLKLIRDKAGEEGEELTYREAQAQAKQVARDLDSKDQSRREAAAEALGGWDKFRELYAAEYGRVVDVITNARGEQFNRITLPSGRSVIQRKAA
jgi:hypothetical protein